VATFTKLSAIGEKTPVTIIMLLPCNWNKESVTKTLVTRHEARETKERREIKNTKKLKQKNTQSTIK